MCSWFSCGSPQPISKRVVIIGGGYAGRDLAQLADPIFDVTWIDPKDCFLHKVGTIRAAVKSNWAPLMTVPKPELHLKRGKRIQAAATAIDEEKKVVTLNDGQSIEYDHLVIATGGLNSSICEPALTATTTSAIQKHFDEVAGKVKDAKNILLVGGGAVGVELAGEIAAEYPDKSVTVVHSGEFLCDYHDWKNKPTANFGKDIATKLEAMKVKVILKTRASVEFPADGAKYLVCARDVSLSSGESLKDVDLVLLCSGFKPSTSFLPRQWLEEKTGCVKVNAQLQVEGQKEVFAIGDCNNHPAPKLMMMAGTQTHNRWFFPRGQADAALANLIALNTNKPLETFADTRKKFAMIVTLGPNASAVEGAPGFAGRFKRGDFFYGNQWYAKGLKVPAVPK